MHSCAKFINGLFISMSRSFKWQKIGYLMPKVLQNYVDVVADLQLFLAGCVNVCSWGVDHSMENQ